MQTQGGIPLNRALFWIAGVLAATFDLVSKYFVFAWLAGQPNGERDILGSTLRFSIHYNHGVVWGMGSDVPLLPILSTAVLLPLIVLVAYSCRAPRAPLWALGLVFGGAVGNLCDRLAPERAVRDFIHIDLGFWPLHPWPIFNLADAFIVIGVVAYLIWNTFYAPAEASAAGTPAGESGRA